MVRRPITIFRSLSCCCEARNSIQYLTVSGLLLLYLPSVILTNAKQGAIKCFKKGGGGSSPDNHLSRLDMLRRSIKSIQYLAVRGPLLLHVPSVILMNAKQDAIICFKKGGGGSSPDNHLSSPEVLLPTCKFHPIPCCKWTALALSPVCYIKLCGTGYNNVFQEGWGWFVAQ